MKRRLKPSSYGKVLCTFDGVFDLPIVAIPNPITGPKISITTRGIVYEGERINPDTKKKKTVSDIIYWSTIDTEPDIINDSGIIPFLKIPIKSSYTLRGRLSKITNEGVDIIGLSREHVDLILSALNITREFKDQEDRDVALQLWSELDAKERESTEFDYYYKEMSRMRIDKELETINYVKIKDNRINIKPEQRKKIIATAKEMVEDNILKYDYLKKSTSLDIANKVVQDFPEILEEPRKHQQFTASIASDSASIETEEGRQEQEKESDGFFTYRQPAWMNESKTQSTGSREGIKSNRRNKRRRTTSRNTSDTEKDEGFFTYRQPAWMEKQKKQKQDGEDR